MSKLNKIMLTQLNLSADEIRRLNYERFHYPSPKIQKRLHVVYLKATQDMSNAKIVAIVDVHLNSVSTYVKASKQQGFDGLCRMNYPPQKSPLEDYSLSIIDDFSKNPICSINQAINRIISMTN